MTGRELLETVVKTLLDAGLPEAESDAWLLFTFVFPMDRARYFLNRDQELPDEEEKYKKLFELTQKRVKGQPVQYLTGVQNFFGLDFHVTPDVLIPRADTEILVDYILSNASPGGKKVLDLCTGSGCIAITLAALGGCVVTASDLSDAALSIARENARKNSVSIAFVHSDLFQSIDGKFDILVSNPPYIQTDVINSLESQVKDCEPRMALDGGADGLDFYRVIACEGRHFLRKDGLCAVEIGYDQRLDVEKLFIDNGWHDVFCLQDLAGLDRVVTARC